MVHICNAAINFNNDRANKADIDRANQTDNDRANQTADRTEDSRRTKGPVTGPSGRRFYWTPKGRTKQTGTGRAECAKGSRRPIVKFIKYTE